MIRNKKALSLVRGTKRDRKNIDSSTSTPPDNDYISMTQEERADDVTWSPIDKERKKLSRKSPYDKPIKQNIATTTTTTTTSSSSGRPTSLLGRARFTKVQSKNHSLSEDKFDTLAAVLNIIEQTKDKSSKSSNSGTDIPVDASNSINTSSIMISSIKENVNSVNINESSQNSSSMIDDRPFAPLSTIQDNATTSTTTVNTISAKQKAVVADTSKDDSFDLIDELFNEEDFRLLESGPAKKSEPSNTIKSGSLPYDKSSMPPPVKNIPKTNSNTSTTSIASKGIQNVNYKQATTLPMNSSNVTSSSSSSKVYVEQVSLEELAMYDDLEKQSLLQATKHQQEIISAEELAMYDLMEQESLTSTQKKTSKRERDNNNPHNEVNKKYKMNEIIPSNPSTSTIRCHRFLALEVIDDYNRSIKEIRCFSQGSNVDGSDWHKNIVKGFQTKVTTVLLTEEWYYSEIIGGDIFHVVELRDDCVNSASIKQPSAGYSIEGSIIVDNNNGLIVINPDVLVTPTKISESCSCIRKGVLSERIKSFDGSNSAGVLGTLRHEFMEAVMEKCMLRLRSFRDNHKNSKASAPEVHMLVTPKEVHEISTSCIKNHIEELFCCDIADIRAMEELKAVAKPTMEWVHNSFCQNTSAAKSDNPQPVGVSNPVYILNEMLASEESIWCPALGMKGCVDVMMNAKLQTISGSQSSPNVGRNFLIPLELKTGQWRPGNLITHRAQVMLYILSLILRERSPIQKAIQTNTSENFIPLPPRHGLLLYVTPEKTVVEIVSPTWHDLRALILSRNKLALSLKKASELGQNRLPTLLKKSFECEGCFHASTCMMYHAALERGNKKTSGVPALFSYLLGKLTSLHLGYFRKWDRLIDLESNVVQSNYQDLWILPGIVKEKKGEKCISNLRSLSCSSKNTDNGKFCIILIRADNFADPIPKNLSKDDRVFLSLECTGRKSENDIEDIGNRSIWEVVSVEPAIATGVISKITELEIHMDLQDCPNRLTELIISSTSSNVGGWSLRIDKDDMNQISMSTMRSNLMSLFVKPHRPKEFEQFKIKNRGNEAKSGSQLEPSQEDNRIHRLRQLIIDLKAPIFWPSNRLPLDEMMFIPPMLSNEQYQQYRQVLEACCRGDTDITHFSGFAQKGPLGEISFLGGLTLYPGCNPIELYQEFCHLNAGQRECVRNVLLAQDYVLLLGLPGTGKTSTLSLIVRALIARGQTVMITSYTHSAVDNLLIKLLESKVSSKFVVRLGGTEPKTQECVLSNKSVSSIENLRSRVASARLIACTVLAASRHNLMSKFKIDWCIVDEAGQIAQPAVLGAIMRANKFILVGDDCQLPPLVISPQAAIEGMDVSLLKRLSESHPEAISCLSTQYRMNEDIMALCNSIVYEYRMFCGSAEIANARLQLPHLNTMLQKLSTCPSNNWLAQCLMPQNSVIFLNTDTMAIANNVLNDSNPASTSSIGANLNEVNIVRSILKCFVDCGIDEEDIGIISPFRAQVDALQIALKDIIPPNKAKSLSQSLTRDYCLTGCDISTVDKFQGRDKDVILFSTVRNMNDRSVGDLLRDWRRVNVALTRSRKKLIIIGSMQIMDRIPVLSKLGKILIERNWVINMT